MIDDSEVIVDYNRQQLMPGWIPRRLGGGLGGKKESGQLRFGGRERPFRAPLRPIPYDDLKRLGIAPPPEGHYMSRFQIPSPPRRKNSHFDREYSPSRQREDSPSRRRTQDWKDSPPRRRRGSTDRDDSSYRRYVNKEYSEREGSSSGKKRSEDREELPIRHRRSSSDRIDSANEHSMNREYSEREDSPSRKRRSKHREEKRRSSIDRDGSSRKHHRHHSEDS